MNENNIEESFIGRNMCFGLEYREGHVFVLVNDYEDTKFKPFGDLEDIEAGSSLDGGSQRLEVTDQGSSKDILHVDKTDDEDVIIHAGIGIAPSMLRMFTQYPEGQSKSRAIPNLGSTISTSSKYAFIDGGDSPYNQPTTASEVVIPPGQHIAFDFYNPDIDDHEPILNIRMRKYKIEPLDPRGSTSERNLINKAASVGTTIPTFPVGNFDNKSTYNLRNEWGVSPISKQEARNA